MHRIGPWSYGPSPWSSVHWVHDFHKIAAAHPMIYGLDQKVEGVSWASNLGRLIKNQQLGCFLLLRFGSGQKYCTNAMAVNDGGAQARATEHEMMQ
jgi:hypothetical protein